MGIMVTVSYMALRLNRITDIKHLTWDSSKNSAFSFISSCPGETHGVCQLCSSSFVKGMVVCDLLLSILSKNGFLVSHS